MDRVEPLLIELPVELLTPRLRLVPPAAGDGLMLNRAIAESFLELNRVDGLGGDDADHHRVRTVRA